ncbi:MAG: 2-succinyl-5-enolpyruvyl-6-hydroxy-3-cyclohexene-1-carboxylic-acid synthase [Kineosporiaceae bacterium]
MPHDVPAPPPPHERADASPPDSAVLARLTVDALVAAGVGHVVLCPGSRSAPLAYRLAELEGSERGPALHVRHDERVAAFTALGVGAAGGLAAVVTTSGTAVANLHPAVLEAHHANVPLVVVSADRPRSLRGTWANQTSDLQAGLFGDALRALVDLADGEAALDPMLALERLRAGIAKARGRRVGARPGPVQLDLGFTEPLVPPPGAAASFAWHADGPTEGAERQPSTLARGPRTVVVAGDRAGDAARRLAEESGWPLLAEPSSGARAGTAAIGPYRLLLARDDLGGMVERVVVLGRPTLSRPVTRLLDRDDVEVVLVSPYPDWPDPGRDVTRATAVRLAGEGPDDPDWLAAWQRAGRSAAAAIDAVLDGWPRLTGPLVAREVARAVATSGDVWVIAASNAVRDVDVAAPPWGHAGMAPLVVANRGLAGIDGTLSTAVGVALQTGRRTRVLVGDLAFLHDANALLPDPLRERPDVQVVLVNDDGGGIFSLLEHGERAALGPREHAAFERVFGTPHGVDVAALCRAHGVGHRLARDVHELRAALAGPARGIEVVEVAAARADLRPLAAALAEAARP